MAGDWWFARSRRCLLPKKSYRYLRISLDLRIPRQLAERYFMGTRTSAYVKGSKVPYIDIPKTSEFPPCQLAHRINPWPQNRTIGMPRYPELSNLKKKSRWSAPGPLLEFANVRALLH